LLIRAAGYDGQNFVLLFSGTLNPALDVNNYACKLLPGPFYAPAVPAPEFGFPGLFFQLPHDLDTGIIYTIELNGIIDDCSGQQARLRTAQLGFPSQPDSSDIVISEIMFDPLTGQPEFVEVFNRSERIVDLKDLILARADASGKIFGFSQVQPVSFWLFPDCFGVLTSDNQLFLKAWPMVDPAVAAERTDMPALTNEPSTLILLDRNQSPIDRAVYSPDWHYPYLEDTKGVSLERISFDAAGTDQSNWFSASASAGGGTPGSKNSSASRLAGTTPERFTLDPMTGYSSLAANAPQVNISYRFEKPGYFMRMNIFSREGLPVREIFQFGLVPVEGIVCWDGLDAAKRVVPDGIYLVVADFYHPSGVKGRWKRACAVVHAY
jgi:hypothetical protein